MKPIHSDVVIAFWRAMAREFGATVVQKDRSKLMGAAGVALHTLGIMDRKIFLEDYVTTIHRTVYVPFAIGSVDSSWDLWNQVVVGVHEFQHVAQGARDGWLVFDAKYLASSTARATYEAEAHGAEMEFHYFLDRQFNGNLSEFNGALFARQRSNALKKYACKQSQIDMAYRQLLMRSQVAKHGVSETRSAQFAISWFNSLT